MTLCLLNTCFATTTCQLFFLLTGDELSIIKCPTHGDPLKYLSTVDGAIALPKVTFLTFPPNYRINFSAGPGSSSASSAKKGPISGLTAMDRKSPVGTSAANSPRKPQSSRDQSDEDTGAGGDSQVGQSTGGDGKSGTINNAQF